MSSSSSSSSSSGSTTPTAASFSKPFTSPLVSEAITIVRMLDALLQLEREVTFVVEQYKQFLQRAEAHESRVRRGLTARDTASQALWDQQNAQHSRRYWELHAALIPLARSVYRTDAPDTQRLFERITAKMASLMVPKPNL